MGYFHESHTSQYVHKPIGQITQTLSSTRCDLGAGGGGAAKREQWNAGNMKGSSRDDKGNEVGGAGRGETGRIYMYSRFLAANKDKGPARCARDKQHQHLCLTHLTPTVSILKTPRGQSNTSGLNGCRKEAF